MERGHYSLEGQQQVLGVRRRLYLVIVGAVIVGVTVAYLTLDYLGGNPLYGVLLPLALLFLVAGFLLLWLRFRAAYLRWVEWGVSLLGVGLTLGMLALTLLGNPLTPAGLPLLTFVSWAPIMYPWFYLVFGSRRGLGASLLFLFTALLVVITYGALYWQATGGLPELSPFVRFATTSLIFMAASYASALVLELHAAARTKAETVAEYAFKDTLTGLPNRLLLQDRLEHVLAHAARHGEGFAVFFIDLDGFKDVNDTYGHQVGDALLQQVAQRLKSIARDADTVARISGDEFALIAAGVHDRPAATALARKLLESYKSPIVIDGHAILMTGSIGVSLYPEDGGDADALLSKADTAMYQAKQLGKNRFYLYKDTVGKETGEFFDLGLHLARALERGELSLHYQPVFDLTDNRLVGVEALARWQHPEFGSIPPTRFIPLAEAYGHIGAIGDWALLTACYQAKAWQEMGYPPLRMSVNVSVVQLSTSRFVERVAAVLNETGLEPEWLELEVTESVVAQDAIAEQLAALRALGVRVVLDDFGTGYSSLGQLHRLPIDGFKIDRSFMASARSPQGAMDSTRVLVKTVVMLARGLGLSVVGEGVESEEQAALLQDSGCDNAQGFLLAKPMEAAEIARLLEAPRVAAGVLLRAS